MSLFTRLKQWYQLSLVQPEHEDASIEAGRQAELSLRQLLDSHFAYQNAHSFLGKRVPGREGGGRREIDLIIVTLKQLHILEVKNWSGELEDHGQTWVQIKRNADRVEVPNLVSHNSEKKDLVQAYLKKHAIEVPSRFVSQKVILMNSHLKVADTIAQLPEVITPLKLEQFLQSQSAPKWAEKMLCSIMEYCLSAEKANQTLESLCDCLTKDKFQQLVQHINELHTWDRLLLYGTKSVTGDLLKIQTQNLTLDRSKLTAPLLISTGWTRGKKAGFVKALLGIGNLGLLNIPGYAAMPLRLEDQLKFHEAGKPEPSYIPLSKVNTIILG